MTHDHEVSPSSTVVPARVSRFLNVRVHFHRLLPPSQLMTVCVKSHFGQRDKTFSLIKIRRGTFLRAVTVCKSFQRGLITRCVLKRLKTKLSRIHMTRVISGNERLISRFVVKTQKTKLSRIHMTNTGHTVSEEGNAFQNDHNNISRSSSRFHIQTKK
jgi:hypothetical protein